MELLVLDTSVLIKWFCKEKGTKEARVILSALKNCEVMIFVPELSKYELGNGLLKGKRLPLRLSKKFFEQFYRLPLRFISEDEESAVRTYQIAENFGMTYYDACFLTLAEKLKATLITENPRDQIQKIDIKTMTLYDYSKSLLDRRTGP